MKIIPDIGSYSGLPYPDVYGEFEVTKIHTKDEVNLFCIRVKNSWPQLRIFVKDAIIHSNQDSIWKILTELKVAGRFAKAIIKKVKTESFIDGQNDIKRKFQELIS